MSVNDNITKNRVLTNAEFFTYENEVWIRTADGSMRVLRETDYDIVNELSERISTFYPKAFEALSTEYKGCSLNRSYYLYRIVCRFIRCNFAALDSIPDIGPNHLCTFEHINCPLRGEGKFDHIICRPEFDHQLSPAEKRVMALVYEGLTKEEIGEHLRLSPLTIHTHVRNAYARLGIHSKGEFIKYAAQHHLFT